MGRELGYGWFRSTIIVPKETEGKRLVAMLDFGSEATVYVDGVVSGAKDLNHHYVTLTRSAKSGEQFEIVAEAYAGHSDSQPMFGESQLCIFEEEVYQFLLIWNACTIFAIISMSNLSALRRLIVV